MEEKNVREIAVLAKIFKFFSIFSIFMMFGCIGIVGYDRQPVLAFTLMGIFALVGVSSLVTGDGLLKRKKWALNAAIILSIALGLLYMLPFILIYFLTRPKVKEQFK